MAAKTTLGLGPHLEARVQRLFMCQGAFAERGLFLRAARGSAKQVTDVDVVAHDYNLNFHHRRIYAECKGGRNKSPLDRVVWVRGLKEAIGADHPHLVIDHCDAVTVQFARSLGVEILQEAGIIALESALKIGSDFWPGRANLAAYAGTEEALKILLSRPAKGNVTDWLQGAAEIWRDASALAFSYGRLNSLLGTLQALGANLQLSPDGEEVLATDYAVAALLVRLSQYVLFAASDTLAMSPPERESYLAERLTAGNLDLEQSRRLLDGAMRMVRAQLQAQGATPPASWDLNHMLVAPAYTKPFVTVVERVIADGDQSRLLPLAMELRLFGFSGAEATSGRMVPRVRAAIEPTGLVIAFARQSLGVPESLSRGPAAQLQGVTGIQTRGLGDHPSAVGPPPSTAAEST